MSASSRSGPPLLPLLPLLQAPPPQRQAPALAAMLAERHRLHLQAPVLQLLPQQSRQCLHQLLHLPLEALLQLAPAEQAAALLCRAALVRRQADRH